jgi:antitoxin component YwqK of YwqJK toxin-antitoxin module
MNQYNENDKPHGYWKQCYSNGLLWYKGEFKMGVEIGYWEIYDRHGEITVKEFYL